jgi:glycosyltransferase involved in cell wall biosynthesis
MNSEKLVSIIVPLYNAENYLAVCLDSILTQSYPNIEVILVDDGSTDNSKALCEDYAKKDSRIRVIHQKNSGPSTARNKGMKVATGDYIQFADSDDFLDHEMVERLVGAMGNDNQLAMCGFQKITLKGNQIHTSKLYEIGLVGEFEKKEFINSFSELYQHYFIHYNWNKLYVSSLIKKSGLAFDTEVSWGEDLLFNLKYLENCKRICTLKDILYYYVDSNDTSITSQFRADLFENMQMMQGMTREFLRRNNAYNGKNKVLFEQFYTSRVVTCLWNLFHPKSSLTPQLTKKQLAKIIHDEQVNRSLRYFRSGDFDKKIIGRIIKNRSVNLLYGYYFIKSFIRKKTDVTMGKWV